MGRHHTTPAAVPGVALARPGTEPLHSCRPERAGRRLGRMTRLVRAILMVLVATSDATSAEARQQSDQQAVVAREPTSRYPDLGPEMQVYMSFIDSEEAELKHLYDVGEVPPADYRLQLDRLVVTREAALR